MGQATWCLWMFAAPLIPLHQVLSSAPFNFKLPTKNNY
jgi:hypothetical protein